MKEIGTNMKSYQRLKSTQYNRLLHNAIELLYQISGVLNNLFVQHALFTLYFKITNDQSSIFYQEQCKHGN